MGKIVHKARFLLLAVVISTLGGIFLADQLEVRGVGSMFGQSVSMLRLRSILCDTDVSRDSRALCSLRV